MKQTSLLLIWLLAISVPAMAQTRRLASAAPATSFRPFFMAAGQHFTANQTFDAVLGTAPVRPFWGGGLEIDFLRTFFVEASLSRFSQSGQRAFVVDGQALPVGVPLTATVMPIEMMAGYRAPVSRRVLVYGGGGVGRYRYQETSTFNVAGEDIDTSHLGWVAIGGAEVRVHRWVAVAVDAHYTHVGGILGDAGVSQAFGESDLGGTALRARVLVGR